MEAKDFKKNEKVLSSSKWSNGKVGIIRNVYEDYVSVNFGTPHNPNYQRFHNKPTHHMQSNINELEKQ